MQSELKTRIEDVYCRLFGEYGPQGWWPVIPEEGGSPAYRGGPRTPRERLEVMLGAVLTQNTAWNGARQALENLHRAGLLEFRSLLEAPSELLAPLLRPSGYFNQKTRKIKQLLQFLDHRYPGRWEEFFREETGRMRELLLEQHGIGPETADSIVLYAAGRPSFVIDAYTLRLFSRLELCGPKARYEELQAMFERALPRDPALFAEYHALIVRHCVERCRARAPHCRDCPLRRLCPWPDSHPAQVFPLA